MINDEITFYKGWNKMNPWYWENNGWTISIASNVPYPYGLYHGSVLHGHFKTSQEAMDRHDGLNREAV